MRNDAATVIEKAPFFIGHEIGKGGQVCHIKHHCEEDPGLARKMGFTQGRSRDSTSHLSSSCVLSPITIILISLVSVGEAFYHLNLTPYFCVCVTLVNMSCLSSSVSLVPYLSISSADYNASSSVLGRQLLMTVVVHAESVHLHSESF